ncbi:purine-nucleoside phosphorylase [Truepera radiovictrix]|uniref:Uridine phosphorylase n=1 Tax=Truepera radiovictrix (strain DSM 17093 / CIP 108686 / LMG 22925 / RQ-24) TaxID=649638 RepID=D7CQ23_TRURR|nr:purine-nucleoside phosphorylase [Truepera radiovictrix]ADI14807.1 purine or other phosphorylase family 1 [Truepera radiovictrix DSM 17093]WMT56642.1 purine-nucleoside phosphorylase [Truepera radiovictrix]
MSPLHIHAEAGDVAPFVLLPGDPNRARLIAETFFEAPRPYTTYRQLLGFSGRYKGLPVSVQATGMGCPSLAIVVEELCQLGVHTLVRVGTAGIIGEGIAPGDLIVASASVPQEGTTRMYLGGDPYAPCASFALTRALADAAGPGVHVGLIQTEDAFYATQPSGVARLRERGVLAVEMEASALFTLGKLRRVETGCVLVASNHIGDPQFVDPDFLRERVLTMTEAALEAGVHLARQKGEL